MDQNNKYAPLYGFVGFVAAILAIVAFYIEFIHDGGNGSDVVGVESQSPESQESDPGLTVPDLTFPASCLDGEISLSRGSGPSGTEVTITGTGWGEPGKKVSTRFGVTEMAPGRVDESSEFTINVVIPGDLDTFAPMQTSITAAVGGCNDSVPFMLEQRS